MLWSHLFVSSYPVMLVAFFVGFINMVCCCFVNDTAGAVRNGTLMAPGFAVRPKPVAFTIKRKANSVSTSTNQCTTVTVGEQITCEVGAQAVKHDNQPSVMTSLGLAYGDSDEDGTD